MNARRFVMLVLTGILVICGARWVYCLLEQERLARSGIGHAIAYTHSDLRRLADHIWMIYQVEKRDPLEIYEKRWRVLTGNELFEALAVGGEIDLKAASDQGWNDCHAIVDTFRRPVHALVRERNGLPRVQLRSDGPNRVDDLGGGDDIVVEVELEWPDFPKRPKSSVKPRE